MSSRVGSRLGFVLVALGAALGCGSARSDDPIVPGGAGQPAAVSGAAGASGGSAAGAGSSGAPAGGTGGTSQLDLCPEAPKPRLDSGTVVALPVRLVLGGKPILFGEQNGLSGGATLVPLNVRFYVSEVTLLRSDGGAIAVDLVTTSGAPEPYGAHLFNAEDAESTSLRLLAPAGDYTGLSFVLGLKAPCNRHNPEGSRAPLSTTSQMTWPHTGYLFFRYEGRYTPDSGSSASGGASGAGGVSAGAAGASGGSSSAGAGATASTGGSGGTGGGSGASTPGAPPAAIHMGGNLIEDLAPRVSVLGPISVPTSGAVEKRLELVLDEVFKGAQTKADLTGFVSPPGGDEVVLGEYLRRALPSLHIFEFQP